MPWGRRTRQPWSTRSPAGVTTTVEGALSLRALGVLLAPAITALGLLGMLLALGGRGVPAPPSTVRLDRAGPS